MSEMKDVAIASENEAAGAVEEYAHMFCDMTRVAGNDDPRVRRFVASTAVRDRYGDEIPLSAWDTKHYLKNPVVLWAHQYETLPIGRAVGLEVTDKALLIDVRFTTPEENPLGDQVLRLYDGGYMRAVSVGFRSKASEWINPEDEEEAKRIKREPDLRPGKRFTKVELLELSAVPVPANPEALMQARQKGLIVPEARNWFCTYVNFPPKETMTDAGAPGMGPVRATEAPTQCAAAPQHDGHAETGKGELPASGLPPDTGQPDVATRSALTTAIEALIEEVKVFLRSCHV